MTGRVDIPALGIDNATADIVTGPAGVERVTVGVDSATFGPINLTDAAFEIRRQSPGVGPWRLYVAGMAAAPGVVDALSVAGNLGSDGTGALDVSSGGVLRLGAQGAAPLVSLSGATATIVRTTDVVSMSAAGALTVLGVPLSFTGELTVGRSATTGTLTAATPTAGVPFGAAILNGTFSLTVANESAAVSFAGTAIVPGLATAVAAAGAIVSNGDSTLNIGVSSLSIDGFRLTAGAFTLQRLTTPAGVSTKLGITAELVVLGQVAGVVGNLSVRPTGLGGTIALTAPDPFVLGGFALAGGFSMEFGSFGPRLAVASSLTIPGVAGTFGATGELEMTGAHLLGSLDVVVKAPFRVGGAASAFTISGNLMLERVLVTSSPPVGTRVVTRLGLSGGTLTWASVGSFSLPTVVISSDGALDVVADAQTLVVGQFTVGLPDLDLHVGPGGADTELRIGSATLGIAGIAPSIALPSFAVATTGSFGVGLPALTELGIGGYGARPGGSFRFERVGGVFKLRSDGSGALAVPGLPAVVALDSFEIGSNGTVAASISARRFGPTALSVRDATISFTRTATTGPNLTASGGKLHLPVGQPISLPTLTFSSDGTLSRTFDRVLQLGPGFTTGTTTVPFKLTASEGVLRLEQTVNRSVPLVGATVVLKNFVAASDGSFSGKVTGTIKPLGFNLANGTFTISKPAGWVDARIELDDPVTVEVGPGLFGNFDGWVATNGRYQLTASVSITAGSWTNAVDPRLITLTGSASVQLGSNGISGTVDGQLCILGVCAGVVGGALTSTGHLTGTWSFNPDGPNNTFFQYVDIHLFTPVPVGNDTTPPSIAPIDDWTVYGEGPVFFGPSVRASDDRDDSPSVVCTPASGTSFAAGSHTVTCEATDDANNKASRSFKVNVIVLVSYSFAVNGTAPTMPTEPPAVSPADTVVFDVGGFAPKTPVSGTLHSTPIVLGSVQSAADGTVSFGFSVPAVAPGRHHLELTGTGPDGGPVQVVIPIDVLAPAVIVTTTIVAPVRVLPRTGSAPRFGGVRHGEPVGRPDPAPGAPSPTGTEPLMTPWLRSTANGRAGRDRRSGADRAARTGPSFGSVATETGRARWTCTRPRTRGLDRPDDRSRVGRVAATNSPPRAPGVRVRASLVARCQRCRARHDGQWLPTGSLRSHDRSRRDRGADRRRACRRSSSKSSTWPLTCSPTRSACGAAHPSSMSPTPTTCSPSGPGSKRCTPGSATSWPTCTSRSDGTPS